MRFARSLSVLAAVAAAACADAGSDRILSVAATGTVEGLVYFDLNGNRAPEAGVDDSVAGIRVRLVAKGTGDSIAGALTPASGVFRMTGVPVGTYRLVVDTAVLADTALVTKIDSTEISVLPGDTSRLNVAISYPQVTIAQARALPPGRKVFLTGIILNAPTTFLDTTMHVQDNTGALRLTRVRATAAQAADSVRVRGTTSRRPALGNPQPTLDDVTTFPLQPRFLPSATTATTAAAATASGGTRDAQQLQVFLATVTDADTVQVGGTFRLTVNDGSGPLEVLLDGTADVQFRPPQLPGVYVIGNRFDIVGLAVPTGTAGVWRLKPRSAQDLVRR